MTGYRIFIEQPAIPEYLTPLVTELRARLGDRLQVAFEPEHQGTRSDPALVDLAAQGRSGWLHLMRVTALPRQTSWFHSGFRAQARHGDVVVLTGNPRVLSNFAWLRRPGVGTVWWGQGWGANSSVRSARTRVLIANRFDVRLFYDQNEEPLIGAWARPPTNYINNTINYSDSEPAIRQDGPRPHYCFIGRLTAKSGSTRLPEIARQLKSMLDGDIRFDIIGDGDARASLESKVAAMGLQGLFTFHGAIFDRGQASHVMRNSNFLIYPGAIGLTTQHALSEGLPVITHSELDRHMPEARLLEDGRNAFLCRDEITAYAEACAKAASISNDSYSKMQMECLRIRQTHSISKMADRIATACEQAHSAAVGAAGT